MTAGVMNVKPMKISFLYLALLAAVMAGCSKGPDADTAPGGAPLAALPEEVRSEASRRGRIIAMETFGLLSSNLQSAIQQSGVSNALPFCSLAASPLTAGMAAKHGVSLRRVTHKPRNPSGQANAAELEVLQHFRTALAATPNPPPSPFVTNFTADTVSFFAPIVLNNELCLRCHGEPERDIQAADLAVIRQLYPRDQATGFRLGELRGAWRIDFPLATLSSSP
jgi:hypothetical protein